MILKEGTPLYRYCLKSDLPENWSSEFENPEYANRPNGKKNQIGAFFFYTNEETAHNVASCALKNYGEQYGISKYTLTRCQAIAEVNLLDLRCQGKTILTLQKLYEAGIDILTDDYFKHNNQRFSEIREQYLEYCEDIKNPYIPEAIRLIDGGQVNQFFRSGTHSLLGQLLTDYSNGFRFKVDLMDNGYEGYIFEEEQSSPTVCLLCADKLSQPSHQVIYKN